jgi:hypothetical protein
MRTVTVELLPCANPTLCENLDSPCYGNVSLKIGDESWEPDPFNHCIVQFHRVPVSDYLLKWIGLRYECGPACDGVETCYVIGSAHQIAIRPTQNGFCPVEKPS